jgi:hypothetical protein
MTRPALTLSALGILLTLSPVWLLNEESILTVSAKRVAQLFTPPAIASIASSPSLTSPTESAKKEWSKERRIAERSRQIP